MKIGDYITISLYGKTQRVRVIAVYPFGTVDVERADGECFRVSGLGV